MSEELKSCPSCGSNTIRLFSSIQTDNLFFGCDECDMAGPQKRTKEEAVAAWNALPRRIRFSKETPETPGLYLWRFNRKAKVVLLEILEGIHPECGGEWAGPLKPEE